jgi:2-amino-4-hydroxy-6-hydroxymethyldihydropteridine diphosphokinase
MTVPARAAFGIGSNLGDRCQYLADAVDRIAAAPGVRVLAVSPMVETEPVGGPDQPRYLNAVVVVETTTTAEELLELAHVCERDAGRVRDVLWGPRTLDVDVLAYDQLDLNSASLTLPHPRATERAFVVVPWAMVDPDFVVAGRTVAQWASSLDHSGVRPVTRTS